MSFFFFNDTATTEIYTLSLHDALPISQGEHHEVHGGRLPGMGVRSRARAVRGRDDSRERGGQGGTRRRQSDRSEEHTSELQSRLHLVCRLLLEKKKPSESREVRQPPPF